MNPIAGAATQIYARRFDHRFLALPPNLRNRIQLAIDELGMNLGGFQHHRMRGVDAYRLRVGDYRVIYEFNTERNELHLITLGHRREIYKEAFN
jgi:mRNA interferase RelE/StbE